MIRSNNDVLAAIDGTSILKMCSLAVSMAVALIGNPSCAIGQSWDPVNGNFDGTNGFAITETANPWLGPKLFGFNGGELTFQNGAESHGPNSNRRRNFDRDDRKF